MALVTYSSTSNTNLGTNNNNLGDASFSSCLNGAKQAFVLKRAESNQSFNPFITNPHENFYLGTKKVEDEELGIFNADKYFKGGINEESPKITKSTKKFEHDKDGPSNLAPAKTKIHPTTLIVRSESSWNSQSAFLKSPLTNPSWRKTKKVHGKSFVAILGCSYCSCNDKNSIEIDESVSEKKIQEPPSKKVGRNSVDLAPTDEMGLGLNREDCFSLRVLNPKKGYLADEDDKARNSLEVFGSPIFEKGTKTLSLERKFTMLNWDSTPRVEETEIPPPSYEEMYNDTGSDASADLFEIESFVNNITPRTCYAPSEASIDWSIVTASSALSDLEELRKTAKTKGNVNKMVRSEKTQKRHQSLLGCKSQKDVRVAEDALITSEKQVIDPRKCYRSMTRFRAETNLTGSDSRNKRQTFSPHSASDSHHLYIQ